MTLPAPYYNHAGITIYHADCRDILPHLEPVDLVLTDPPYNIGYHYESYDDNLPEPDYLKLLSLIKTPAVLIHYPEQTINLLPRVLGPCDETISWIYHNPLPVVKDFRLVSWWGVKPDLTRVREPYANATLSDKRARGKHHQDGKGVRDWWLIESVRYPCHENTDHPCQIPTSLMQRIMKVTDGQSILDPFMGSGTTLVAAKQLGRKAIGIEIEEKYCEIAVRRLAQEVLPL